jgi:predicted metal-dependent HD superfamily phosphohydrolase
MASSAPVALPPGARAELETLYATPPRAYHDLGHVQEVLRHYAEVAQGPGWLQPVEPYLAVLYHDAIYEPRRRDNESRSARLAIARIAQWWPDAGVDGARVAQLIEYTARHGQLNADDVDRDAALFLDCDMAILGAEPVAFDAYDRGIAAEYRHLPGWLFKMARRRFLKALLARERIFLSDFFRDRYEARARGNLRRAITQKR